MPRAPSLAAATFLLAFSESGAAEPSSLPPEIGYNHGELETPRSAALAGGLRAMSNSIEAIYLNPANMAATPVYHVGGAAQIWPQASRQSYGGAAVDSVVNRQRIAGGIAANWTRQDPDGVNRKAFDLRFALAAPLGSEFLVGGGLRYLSLSESGFPRSDGGLRPSIASGGLEGQDIVEELTFDAGITLKPVEGLNLALVGQNLTDPGHGFAPLLFGGGAGFGSEEFSLEVDAVGDFTTYDTATMRVMGGGEFLVGDSFPLRGGYGIDDGSKTQFLSGGIGFVSREFSVDASLRGVVEGPRSFTFVIGFKYHAESSFGFGSSSQYE